MTSAIQSNDDGYERFFKTAFAQPPFAYQHRIATDPAPPALINAPTGAGKTAARDILSK